jgi:hypothetical protein
VPLHARFKIKKENKIMLTEEDFKTFIDNYPELTPDGFCERRMHEHHELKNYYVAFVASCEVLIKRYETSQNPKHLTGSYPLKHKVEQYNVGLYVPQGAFIAAVLHLGMPYKRIKGNSGIQLKLKELSIA